MFAHPGYLHGIQVTFMYEGHQVKVKVTGARNVENPYSYNVKLPISSNSGFMKQSHEVCMQSGVFGYGRSNGATAIFVR